MSRFREAEDPRRRLLIRALAAGFFSESLVSRRADAQALGSRPEPLPQGRSIYRIDGQVLVDGAQATLETRVSARAVVQTGASSEVVYAVGTSAYLQRSDSTVTLQSPEPDSATVSGVEVIAGKILSVFPSGRAVRLTTKNASIGIRSASLSGTCTIDSPGIARPPKNAAIPIMPSSPTVATSTAFPFFIIAVTEQTPPLGK